MLALLLTPGVGPVRAARLVETFGSAAEVRNASPAQLRRVKGIGEHLSASIASELRQADPLARAELELAQSLGVHLIQQDHNDYPPLLRQMHTAPLLLYAKGTRAESPLDPYPLAVIGSRECTHYGIEQAERFAGVLASSGITVVSGGARGIDSAAHRGALRSLGRTVAILGCGLAHTYPPENKELFDAICSLDDHGRPRGMLLSELPLNTPPSAENFPARNRLISGMSLGVLVIEAGMRSGALITARIAAEDHGREVMALPGRVDSRASAGSHDLLKSGGATLVTDPGDVLQLLETPARHLYHGTHQARYEPIEANRAADLFQAPPDHPPADLLPNPVAVRVYAALAEPRTLDELVVLTALAPGDLLPVLTMLEIQKRIIRAGPHFRRRA
ncbi:MAG: DNA-processing protein DprA [Phycisphaeraceae bacterium]|nr:DNA-processing protein DprA [Phycisphaeraceae bacterium]